MERMKEKLVLVGNGMAGVRVLEELLKQAPDKYDITVFGAEPLEITTASCYLLSCREKNH